MESIYDFYLAHAGIIDPVICLAIFIGATRIAFWDRHLGFHLSGPLVVGLACLLTVSLISWADRHHYQLIDLGPLALFIIIEVVVVLIINAAVRTR